MKTSIKNGRPPKVRNSVVNHMRNLIVRGKLAPGDRLPTYHELQRKFGVDADTIRDAMELLQRANFIETKPRQGMFVTANPPHLAHFALAFPYPIIDGVSRFYEALRDEAGKLQAPERRVSAFYDIGSHADVDDYQRLWGFAQAQRLAGVIFAGDPYPLELIGSPLVKAPGLIRTAIMLPGPGISVSYPTVYPDLAAFLPKAFDYLAQQGARRVAVVMLAGGDQPDIQTIQNLASARGLLLRPHWLQACSPGSPAWIRQTAALLLHDWQTERPDSVVITDDNLVPGITEGIRDSGVPVAACDSWCQNDHLKVVAQANFPYPTRCAVPAKRLGYNIPRLINVCLKQIELQRRGEPVPAHTAIPVEFG